MEHAPGSAGDVRFLALLNNLDAVIVEVGLVATVKQVRHSLSSRLGLPEVALDGWSADLAQQVSNPVVAKLLTASLLAARMLAAKLQAARLLAVRLQG